MGRHLFFFFLIFSTLLWADDPPLARFERILTAYSKNKEAKLIAQMEEALDLAARGTEGVQYKAIQNVRALMYLQFPQTMEGAYSHWRQWLKEQQEWVPRNVFTDGSSHEEFLQVLEQVSLASPERFELMSSTLGKEMLAQAQAGLLKEDLEGQGLGQFFLDRINQESKQQNPLEKKSTEELLIEMNQMAKKLFYRRLALALGEKPGPLTLNFKALVSAISHAQEGGDGSTENPDPVTATPNGSRKWILGGNVNGLDLLAQEYGGDVQTKAQDEEKNEGPTDKLARTATELLHLILPDKKEETPAPRVELPSPPPVTPNLSERSAQTTKALELVRQELSGAMVLNNQESPKTLLQELEKNGMATKAPAFSSFFNFNFSTANTQLVGTFLPATDQEIYFKVQTFAEAGLAGFDVAATLPADPSLSPTSDQLKVAVMNGGDHALLSPSVGRIDGSGISFNQKKQGHTYSGNDDIVEYAVSFGGEMNPTEREHYEKTLEENPAVKKIFWSLGGDLSKDVVPKAIRQSIEDIFAQNDSGAIKVKKLENLVRELMDYSIPKDQRSAIVGKCTLTRSHYLEEFFSRFKMNEEGVVLERPQGVCIGYAEVMLYLLRLFAHEDKNILGSRLVSGYRSSKGLILNADRHAWVEVYLKGKGWQRFDPTGSNTDQLPSDMKEASALRSQLRGQGQINDHGPAASPRRQSLAWAGEKKKLNLAGTEELGEGSESLVKKLAKEFNQRAGEPVGLIDLLAFIKSRKSILDILKNKDDVNFLIKAVRSVPDDHRFQRWQTMLVELESLPWVLPEDEGQWALALNSFLELQQAMIENDHSGYFEPQKTYYTIISKWAHRFYLPSLRPTDAHQFKEIVERWMFSDLSAHAFDGLAYLHVHGDVEADRRRHSYWQNSSRPPSPEGKMAMIEARLELLKKLMVKIRSMDPSAKAMGEDGFTYPISPGIFVQQVLRLSGGLLKELSSTNDWAREENLQYPYAEKFSKRIPELKEKILKAAQESIDLYGSALKAGVDFKIDQYQNLTKLSFDPKPYLDLGLSIPQVLSLWVSSPAELAPLPFYGLTQFKWLREMSASSISMSKIKHEDLPSAFRLSYVDWVFEHVVSPLNKKLQEPGPFLPNTKASDYLGSVLGQLRFATSFFEEKDVWGLSEKQENQLFETMALLGERIFREGQEKEILSNFLNQSKSTSNELTFSYEEDGATSGQGMLSAFMGALLTGSKKYAVNKSSEELAQFFLNPSAQGSDSLTAFLFLTEPLITLGDAVLLKKLKESPLLVQWVEKKLQLRPATLYDVENWGKPFGLNYSNLAPVNVQGQKLLNYYNHLLNLSDVDNKGNTLPSHSAYGKLADFSPETFLKIHPLSPSPCVVIPHFAEKDLNDSWLKMAELLTNVQNHFGKRLIQAPPKMTLQDLHCILDWPFLLKDQAPTMGRHSYGLVRLKRAFESFIEHAAHDDLMMGVIFSNGESEEVKLNFLKKLLQKYQALVETGQAYSTAKILELENKADLLFFTKLLKSMKLAAKDDPSFFYNRFTTIMQLAYSLEKVADPEQKKELEETMRTQAFSWTDLLSLEAFDPETNPWAKKFLDNHTYGFIELTTYLNDAFSELNPGLKLTWGKKYLWQTWLKLVGEMMIDTTPKRKRERLLLHQTAQQWMEYWQKNNPTDLGQKWQELLAAMGEFISDSEFISDNSFEEQRFLYPLLEKLEDQGKMGGAELEAFALIDEILQKKSLKLRQLPSGKEEDLKNIALTEELFDQSAAHPALFFDLLDHPLHHAQNLKQKKELLEETLIDLPIVRVPDGDSAVQSLYGNSIIPFIYGSVPELYVLPKTWKIKRGPEVALVKMRELILKEFWKSGDDFIWEGSLKTQHFTANMLAQALFTWERYATSDLPQDKIEKIASYLKKLKEKNLGTRDAPFWAGRLWEVFADQLTAKAQDELKTLAPPQSWVTLGQQEPLAQAFIPLVEEIKKANLPYRHWLGGHLLKKIKEGQDSAKDHLIALLAQDNLLLRLEKQILKDGLSFYLGNSRPNLFAHHYEELNALFNELDLDKIVTEALRLFKNLGSTPQEEEFKLYLTRALNRLLEYKTTPQALAKLNYSERLELNQKLLPLDEWLVGLSQKNADIEAFIVPHAPLTLVRRLSLNFTKQNVEQMTGHFKRSLTLYKKHTHQNGEEYARASQALALAIFEMKEEHLKDPAFLKTLIEWIREVYKKGGAVDRKILRTELTTLMGRPQAALYYKLAALLEAFSTLERSGDKEEDQFIEELAHLSSMWAGSVEAATAGQIKASRLLISNLYPLIFMYGHYESAGQNQEQIHRYQAILSHLSTMRSAEIDEAQSKIKWSVKQAEDFRQASQVWLWRYLSSFLSKATTPGDSADGTCLNQGGSTELWDKYAGEVRSYYQALPFYEGLNQEKVEQVLKAIDAQESARLSGELTPLITVAMAVQQAALDPVKRESLQKIRDNLKKVFAQTGEQVEAVPLYSVIQWALKARD